MYYLKNLIIFILIACSANLSFADKITIFNLSFEYTVESEIDADQKEIKIGDYSKIIKIKNLQEFLVEHYFLNSKTSYSFSEISEFLKQAIAASAQPFVFLTVKKISGERDWTYQQAAELLDQLTPALVAEIARKDQFEMTYELSKRTNTGKYLLLIALEHYSTNFLNNCCSKPFDLVPTIAFYLKQQLAKGKAPIEIINDFYRKKSTVVNNEEIKTIEKIISDFIVLAQLNSSFPKTYLALAEKHPQYFAELKEFLLTLREQALDNAINLKNFQIAFDLLLLQDVNERTETTHQLVNQLLKNIDLGFAPLLIIDPYKSYISAIAEKDFQVKETFIAKLEEIITSLVLSGKTFEAKEYLAEVFNYRVNPNSDNTNLIFILVKEFDKKNLRDQVYLLRDTYQSSYSLKQKFWFFKNGYYFSLLFVWGFIGLLIGFFVLVYLKIIKIDKFREAIKKSLKEVINLKTIKPKDPATEFSQKFDQLNSDRQKYKSMLKYFEMNEKCTLEQIKSNYRKKIKAYHPDLNPTQTELDRLKFLEITERYEELLGLYSRFGPK